MLLFKELQMAFFTLLLLLHEKKKNMKLESTKQSIPEHEGLSLSQTEVLNRVIALSRKDR